MWFDILVHTLLTSIDTALTHTIIGQLFKVKKVMYCLRLVVTQWL